MQGTLQRTAPLVTSAAISKDVSVVPIGQDDFTFVHYTNLHRVFKVKRPYCVIKTPPNLDTYADAIYQPLRQTLFNGCLYDAQKERIEASCVKRGITDTCLTQDSRQFTEDAHALPIYEQPLLYLGHLLPHYGHFLLEFLSRWWPLIENVDETQHYLLHLRDPKALDRPYIRACLDALKIDRDKMIFFDQPTKLKQVVVPEPAFQIHSHIFIKYKELCGKVTEAIAGTKFNTTDQPLYVSRRLLSSDLSGFRGEEPIETFLSARGVRVIHPQMLSFEEQVRIYNEHKTIIGLNGSGLLNIAFSLEPKNVIALTHHYLAPNYFLINKCFDAKVTYLQACTSTDRLRWLYDLLLAKTIHRKQTNGKLNRIFNLDHQRVIQWFAQSGYC